MLFTNKVKYNKMKIKQDLKAEIEDIYEDGIPVKIESDCFTAYNIFKVSTCITSPLFDLIKHISLLPKWKRTLVKNFKKETSE